MKTKTAITLLTICATAAFGLGTPAHAGTRSAPELTDPAGDVPLVLSPGRNDDWADIVGAWLEPIDGGIRLNVETVSGASAAAEDLTFYSAFDVLAGQNDHCYFNVDYYATEGDETLYYGPSATLQYGCAGEKQPFTIPFTDVTFDVASRWNADLPAPVFNGPVTSVDIPFAAFSEGLMTPMFAPGTRIQPTGASTQILTDTGFLPGDQRESCEPSYTPPFTFEAGCPEPFGIFTIS